jgi:hypothetical protein
MYSSTSISTGKSAHIINVPSMNGLAIYRQLQLTLPSAKTAWSSHVRKPILFKCIISFDRNSKRTSIRPNPLEGSGPASIMKSTIERISLHHAIDTRPVDPPAKSQNTARLRTNYEMLVIDGAFHAP